MLTKRIIPCLDVRAGKVTKGVKFEGNVDVGDPVDLARMYYEQGADEIVFYDITASNEKRDIFIDVVERVAKTIFIPFTVGGGLRSVEDMRKVLLAGAEKVSIDSGAVRDPNIITLGSKAFGAQCILLSMQVLKVPQSEKIPSGYEVYIDGGRKPTGLDALKWAQEGVERGAGEICVNSIDGDGTKDGFELSLTGRMAELVSVPVIASGGGGRAEHVIDVFKKTQAEAAILASILHNGETTISQIKALMKKEGIPAR
jgi:imidazole glycerol-phosphate synthase subunit HisF